MTDRYSRRQIPEFLYWKCEPEPDAVKMLTAGAKIGAVLLIVNSCLCQIQYTKFATIQTYAVRFTQSIYYGMLAIRGPPPNTHTHKPKCLNTSVIPDTDKKNVTMIIAVAEPLVLLTIYSVVVVAVRECSRNSCCNVLK